MPYSHNDPLPKNFKVKIQTHLASFVDFRVLVRVLIVYIHFHKVGKKTMPACEKCIIKHRQPIKEKDLTRKAIIESKV